MRLFLSPLLLAGLVTAPILAGDTPATTQPDAAQAATLQELATPEGQVKLWLKMARQNDFAPILTLIPEQEWVQVERYWRFQLAKQSPKDDAKLDQELAQLRKPGAVEALMGTIKPQLEALKPDQMALAVRGLGALLAQQVTKPGADPNANPALQGFQSWLGDVATWIEKGGINDLARTQKALEALVDTLNKLQVTSAQNLRQTRLQDLLARLGPAAAALKNAFRAYDINLDAIIDSVKIVNCAGAGVRRTMTVSFVVFNRERRLDIDLIKRGSTWEVLGAKGQPFLPFAPAIDPLLKAMGIGGGVKEAPPVPADGGRPPGTL